MKPAFQQAHELFTIFDKQVEAYLLKIDCLKSSVSRR